MGIDSYNVFSEAVRILFLVGLPVTIGAAVAGLLISAFQSATSMPDPASSYAFRLAAVVVLLYLIVPGAGRMLLELAARAFM